MLTIKNYQKLKEYLEKIFSSRRQMAISLREHFSYNDTATIMNISKKGVWMHCTSHAKKRFADKKINENELNIIKSYCI